ncbi:MAG: PVC-type heme-binding CxxCH protein [Verrucomicrobiota bacterium]
MLPPRPVHWFLILALPVSVLADFPAIYNSEKNLDSNLLDAAEAGASFQLPEGFEITVFASEPEVQNPIAMTWDHRGRLWIAENYTYAERGTRFDLALRDRVLIFEDEDWDGVADKRTVFTENVQMLTSVEVGRGGVWLMCPPQLLFVPDRDGDDIPDGEPEIMLDGFTVAFANYHNFANGLRWGPDGWLYGRCGHSCPGKIGIPGTPEEERIPIDGGIWRFHPERKVVEVLTHGTTNPWGHDWDKHGEFFFINTVNGHLWHMIPGAHFKENFGFSQNRLVYERLDHHADHWHFDTGQNWTKSRHGAANDYGGGHAHIGMMIYQADQLPETFHDKLLTWNMHGRRANVERLERHGSGYVGRHEPDVFLSGDEWFRGIDLSTGPDGSIFAIDWSDTGECHEHTGVHRESGRIYRISHGKPAKPDLSDLVAPSDAYLWSLLKHPNPWFERQARIRLTLTRNPNKTLVANLKAALRDETFPTFGRLRAMWMLNALDELTKEELKTHLGNKNEHVRTWAIRFLVDTWPMDTLLGPTVLERSEEDQRLVEELVRWPGTGPDSGIIPLDKLALSSALQKMPLESRAMAAAALLSECGEKAASDHNLAHMIWYGVSPLLDHRLDDFISFFSDCENPQLARWSARALATKSKHVDKLVEHALRHPSLAEPVLQGMVEGFRIQQKAPRPPGWDKVKTRFGKGENTAEHIRQLDVLFGDGLSLEELGRVALDGSADFKTREAAVKTLVRSGSPESRAFLEKLLPTRFLNTEAVKGLATFDDPSIGKTILSNYNKFHPKDRNIPLEVLTSRAPWASQLLQAVEKGRIPKENVTPFHARQIESLGDTSLSSQLAAVWGRIRTSSEEKKKRVAELQASLTPEFLSKADLSRGRFHYQLLCGTCHVMYGEGGKLGPDLTGSGRSNLDYLLENVIDPSAVVTTEFQMTLLELKDGRSLPGVIAQETKDALTLRTLTEEIVIPTADIVSRTPSPLSIMPEGLFDALPPEQTRDLIAYLMHPRQVELKPTP